MLMLRTMQKARYDAVQPRALRPGRRRATATSRRRSAAIPTWSSTARCARSARAQLTEERVREWERSCRRRPATRPTASAGPTRPSARSAVEEGPLHGRQGRRGVPGLRDRRRAVRALRAARSSTSSTAWCTSRAWPTTTTASSTASTCCSARTRGRATGWATRSWPRSRGWTWSAGRWSWGSPTSWMSCASPSGTADPRRSTVVSKVESRKRASRPGRREREQARPPKRRR